MIRALQPPHAALGLVEQPRAAVAADVEERARAPVVAGDHEHALAAELAREERAAAVERAGVPGARPAAEEQVLELPRGDRLVGERARRQLPRLGERPKGRLELGGAERHATDHTSARVFDPTVPNLLTVFRILLVPVLVAALLSGIDNGDLLAAIIFVIASITDALDG